MSPPICTLTWPRIGIFKQLAYTNELQIGCELVWNLEITDFIQSYFKISQQESIISQLNFELNFCAQLILFSKLEHMLMSSND